MVDLNRRIRYFIHDDVGKAWNDKLSGSYDSSSPSPGRKKFEGVGGVKQGFSDGFCRLHTISPNVKDDVFKILCDGGSPSYLHSLRPLTISELQNPLHSCPNFCCGDKVTTRGSFSSGLYGGAKVGLFRNVTLHGFTGQLIRAPACLGGYLGELRFLLDAELNDHILRLGVSEVGVNSPGRR
jgi:hypothetical protein